MTESIRLIEEDGREVRLGHVLWFNGGSSVYLSEPNYYGPGKGDRHVYRLDDGRRLRPALYANYRIAPEDLPLLRQMRSTATEITGMSAGELFQDALASALLVDPLNLAPSISEDRMDVFFDLQSDRRVDESLNEPHDALIHVDGRLLYGSDGGKDSGAVLATLSGIAVTINRVENAGEMLFEVFDSYSGDALDCYTTFFEGDCWRDEVISELGDVPATLLLVEHINVPSALRGRGFGRILLRSLLKAPIVPSATVVTLLPHAFGDEDGTDSFVEGVAKVRAYWASAGMRPLTVEPRYLYAFIE